MIKRKRNAMQKYLKNDIADLLKNGLDFNAYGRVISLFGLMGVIIIQYLNDFEFEDSG